ncbi:Coenzyme Q-binding protein coq10a, mitochondrial [Mortierella sp. GBA30]|nr:Coenzyme Q-binding protein coq10a, mitochondrial [Mortierella sp. GBA30]
MLNLLKPLSISTSRYYRDRTLLKYSQQEFYDLVANVDDYHKFLPWCTYSKMSAPVLSGSTSDGTTKAETQGTQSKVESTRDHKDIVSVRHGELGIGFNSLQERYVSTVTCQEPWMVRAVSYDSKLFKELSTTWKFTPNVPKTTTLEATMDQEVQEAQLLVRPTEEEENVVQVTETFNSSSEDGGTGSGGLVQDLDQGTESEKSASPLSTSSTSSAALSSSKSEELSTRQPEYMFYTATSVFGPAAVPWISLATKDTTTYPECQEAVSAANGLLPSPILPSTNSPIPIQEQLEQIERQHPPRPLPARPKQTTERTASRSNLTTMKPSDFPLVWVDFEIQFEFASPVHATMSSLFFDQVSREMLAAFVKRAEVLYGKR